MRISPRLAAPTVLAALASLVVLGACKKADETADTAAAMPAPSTEAAMTSASPMEGLKGKWNMRAVPETGDTTPTVFVLDASGDSSSWTINFPNRPPVPTHVIAAAGDSVVAQSAEYESVRRKGVKVTTTSVFRVQGDRISGTTTAHYKTTGADSVMRLRAEGTKAP